MVKKETTKPKLLKLKKKIRGKITEISTRKTWFSDAMDELEKQEKKQ